MKRFFLYGKTAIILGMSIKERKTGVLMHISSLPSVYGIGDVGDAAMAFADSLADNCISLWQILPTGPTGYGDSPYAARSAFAGNELFISPKELYIEGYIELSDVLGRCEYTERVDYGKAREFKMPLLEKAAECFLKSGREMKSFSRFCKDNSFWLDDYALFQALCEKFNDSRWYIAWPEELRNREDKAIVNAIEENKERIDIYKALQYFFFKQWAKFKAHANSRGIEIVGDIPIFVAADSSDAWSNRKLLKIDGNGQQEVSSGVPPDAFSSTGQLWGNPVYRWEEHKKNGFRWWIDRIKACLRLADIVRIDHFRGFEACWEVPAGEATAENGKWVKGPGSEFFDAVKRSLGSDLPIIAEDLGVITDEVNELRISNDLPGMKIIQFAFGFKADGSFDAGNAYLPHSYEKLCVAYTGTHDNNTTLGWYEELDDKTKDAVRRYFECGDDRVLWTIIRTLLASSASWVIIPMQDILGLGKDARMNTPSTCGGSNWAWRMREEDIASPSLEGIRYYSRLYGRTER